MASLKYLTHINLNGNQLQGAAIEGLGSAPSNNLQVGRLYYDTSASSNKYLRIYQSSGSWQDIVGTTLTQTLTNKTLTSAVLNTGVSGTAIKDEDNMVSNSATHLATQQSIKAYVDNQLDTKDTLAELDDTTIGTLASGHILIYDGSDSWDNKVLSGDAGIVASGALTLATVNSNVGSFGSATAIPAITVNAKGLITAVSTNSISTTLTIDDASSTQNVSLATDDLQFLSASANEITTAVTKVGTDVKVTIGLPDDVTIGQDLTVSRNLTVTGKQVLGSSGTANLYLGNEIAANSANKGARFHSDNNDFFMDFQGDATQLWTLRDYDGSGGIHDRFIFNFVNGNFTATGDLIASDDLQVSDDASIGGDLTVTGNLTVNGTTTTISTTNLDVEDAIIMLQAELGSSTANATDMGIIMERGSTGDNAAIIWDEGADKFILGTTTETGADSDVTVTAGTLVVGTIEATSCDVGNYNLAVGDIPNLPASKITSGTFATARIADGAITTVKLAADAVDGTKLADDAINSEHITDGSVDRVHLAADIIDSTKLADDAVDTEHIADDAVTLGTHTTGSYVTSLVAGANVTLSNNSGESATPTIAVANSAIDARIDARSSAHTISNASGETATEFTITYGFTAAAINDVLIQVVDSYASSSCDGDTVFAEVERHSTTQCKVKFSVAPAVGHTYRVLCFKIA